MPRVVKGLQAIFLRYFHDECLQGSQRDRAGSGFVLFSIILGIGRGEVRLIAQVPGSEEAEGGSRLLIESGTMRAP